MESFNKKWLTVLISSLMLTACLDSDDNDNDDDDHGDEHDHEFSIMVSQSSTTGLSLVEEGELEAVEGDAAGNGATLVLSEDGAFAAVASTGTVNFVHGLHEEEEGAAEEEEHEEAHMLEYSLTGSKVITTSGHFAVLDAGSTTFVAYGELENATPAEEDTTALSIDEAYPALVLDEEHDLKLVFDGTNAKVFEGTTEELNISCANPTSHAQGHELVVVSCDEGAVTLLVEEEAGAEPTFEQGLLTLDGTAANYMWYAQGEAIVGYEAGTVNYAVVELDETAGTIEVVQGSDTAATTFTDNICALALDSEAGDVLVVTSAGNFVAMNHEGETLESITLDESSQSTCTDFVLAPAAKTAILVDNNAMIGYEIDVDEPETNPNGYHVHERFNLTVSDIANMVVFHEKEEHDHDHE